MVSFIRLSIHEGELSKAKAKGGDKDVKWTRDTVKIDGVTHERVELKSMSP